MPHKYKVGDVVMVKREECKNFYALNVTGRILELREGVYSKLPCYRLTGTNYIVMEDEIQGLVPQL